MSYQSLIEKWQPRLNLVSAASLGDFWLRHAFDSAQLFSFLSPDNSIVADLGSGAGFPGLVLAILAQGINRPLNVHLVESDTRKAAFLLEAARALQLLERVTIHNRRAESLASDATCPRFDLVVARALAAVDTLLGLAQPLLKPGGRCLFLKGESLQAELVAAQARGWEFRPVVHPSRSGTGSILEITSPPSRPALVAAKRRGL
jgi:16S rRNA (guanine527-N7)-methyltransferase